MVNLLQLEFLGWIDRNCLKKVSSRKASVFIGLYISGAILILCLCLYVNVFLQLYITYCTQIVKQYLQCTLIISIIIIVD